MPLISTNTVVTSSLNPSTFGDSVTLYATVTPNPPSIAQAGGANFNTGTAVVIGIANNPTPGNLLVALAFCAPENVGPVLGITGFIEQATYTNAGQDGTVWVGTRVVQAGDGNSYTVDFTGSAGGGDNGGILFEVVGWGAISAAAGLATVVGQVAKTPNMVSVGSTVFAVLVLPFGTTTATYTPSYFTVGASNRGSWMGYYTGTPTAVSVTETFTGGLVSPALYALVQITSGGVLPPLTGTVDLVDSISGTLNPNLPLVSGVGNYPTNTLNVNTHDVTATYSGDSNYSTSSGMLAQVVNSGGPTITTLASSQNPQVVGQDVTFTMTFTPEGGGSPTGDITLSDDSTSPPTVLAVLPVTGSLMYVTDSLSVGDHLIVASYPGDGIFDPSYAILTQVIGDKFIPPIVLVSSEDPSLFGDGVMFTIMVKSNSGVPTGTVLLHDNFGDFLDQTLPLVPIDGIPTASYGPTTALSVGSHMVTATYSGDADFASVETTLIQLVLTPKGDILFDMPGFAIASGYSSQGDTNLPSWASFSAVPSVTTAGTPVYILWTSNNVVAVEIAEISGSPPYPPVVLTTGGSGIYEFPEGFVASTVLACTGLDSNGNAVATENVLITVT